MICFYTRGDSSKSCSQLPGLAPSILATFLACACSGPALVSTMYIGFKINHSSLDGGFDPSRESAHVGKLEGVSRVDRHACRPYPAASGISGKNKKVVASIRIVA